MEGKGLKILTTKQMIPRFPIDFAQTEEGNTSKNLLNEIRQITFYQYREKGFTKKVCNNVMNSIKLYKQDGYYIYEF